ncbi:MAG: response regulator transcription factor [Chloroflexota bacterium]
MKLRILLVDDHEVVRVGLKALINDQPGMEVVGEAATAREAVIQAGIHRPDIVVLDLRLPDGHGVDVCRNVKAKFPSIRIIVLTSYADDDAILDAIAYGAEGYVLKKIGSDEILDAIRRVGRGENILDPSVTETVLSSMRHLKRQEWAHAFSGLNARELNILALVTEGKTNGEIGQVLHLSERTVRNYVSTILSKLNLKSRTQAAAFAARNRIEDYC